MTDDPGDRNPMDLITELITRTEELTAAVRSVEALIPEDPEELIPEQPGLSRALMSAVVDLRQARDLAADRLIDAGTATQLIEQGAAAERSRARRAAGAEAEARARIPRQCLRVVPEAG